VGLRCHPAVMPLGPVGEERIKGWSGSYPAYAGSRGELIVLGHSILNSDTYAPKGKWGATSLNMGVRVTWQHQKGN